ncbi:hypothetical protein [Kordia sp.]|uniref:hypothetical protein n=1 Tax=Kordia sp. TaxID=1965332 RepID=UPI003D6C02B1
MKKLLKRLGLLKDIHLGTQPSIDLVKYYRESEEDLRKKNRKDAINAKAKGISEEEQIKTAKVKVENLKSTSKAYYADEEISSTQELDNIEKELKDREQNFDENVESDIQQSSSKNAQKVNDLEREIENDSNNVPKLTRETELLEEDHPQKPIIDKNKVKLIKFFVIILAVVLVFIGYSLNRNFFSMIIGSSSAAIIISAIFGLLDSWVAHKIGSHLANKNSKMAKTYIVTGAFLLSIVFIGQNAALKQEEKYDNIFATTEITDDLFEVQIEDDSEIGTDLLRAGFICFLFILSAATGYEYQQYKTKLLPFDTIKEIQNELNSTKQRIAKNTGKKKVLQEKLRANAKKERTSEIQRLKKQAQAIQLKKSQLVPQRDQDITSLENLEKLMIADVKKIYSNQA